jgi:hypothetical protein
MKGGLDYDHFQGPELKLQSGIDLRLGCSPELPLTSRLTPNHDVSEIVQSEHQGILADPQ